MDYNKPTTLRRKFLQSEVIWSNNQGSGLLREGLNWFCDCD